MKIWKLLASTLLVLVGFCAGIGWNFFSLSPTAHGATPSGTSGPPEPPPVVLKSVAHDATLTGNGTDSTPLGIANGGVSAPKLSTSATPSIGQVLGFNGANLAWQNAPVGGARVVDSLGHEAGLLVANYDGSQLYTYVLSRIGESAYLIGANNDGWFRDTIALVLFYHTSTNCSGARYLQAYDNGSLIRHSDNTTTQLLYAAGPLQPVTLMSVERVRSTDLGQTYSCSSLTPFTVTAGIATSLDLSSLSLTPPFHPEF